MRRQLLVAVFAALTAASIRAHAASFTLHSGLCDGSFGRESTAVSVHTAEGTFLIASADAVLASSDAKACHTIQTAQGAPIVLQLMRYDWASGLALFAAPPTLGADAESLSEIKPRLLQPVTLAGAKGRIVSATSHRHQFANISDTGSAIEIDTTEASASLLGSAVRAADQSVLGFVSSHYLIEHPGRSSVIARWMDAAPSNHATLIALPSSFVRGWITAVLAPNWLPIFAIDPQDQIQNRHVITYGPLTLSETCPTAQDEPDPANPPIGGVDPIGIGGVDPIGIGGDSVAFACRFLLAPGHLKTAAPSGDQPALGLDRATQFSRLDQRVKAGETLAVKMAYLRDDGGLLQGSAFMTIESLSQAVVRNKYGLLVIPDRLFTDPNNSLEIIAQPDMTPAIADHPASAINSAAMIRELALTAHGTPEALKELVRSSLQLIYEVSRPWGLVSVRERSFLYAGLQLTSEWSVVTDQDLAILDQDAMADQSSLIYIPHDVESVINARKEVKP